jgi:glycosyltransferase involved in cell wall biosynthesis
MKLCVISFKKCWREGKTWFSQGGFPLQVSHMSTIFEHTELLITETGKKQGGIPIDPAISVLPMHSPAGKGLVRKVFFVLALPYYVCKIIPAIRRADVVHTPLPGDIPLLGMILAVLMRKRLIARYCGSWEKDPNDTAARYLTRRLMRLLSSGNNVMMTTGGDDLDRGRIKDAKGIQTIFSTAISRSDLALVRPDLRRPLNCPAQLVYLGRLSYGKGVEDLIHALSYLKHDYPGVEMPRLTIIGGGPDSSKLRGLAEELGCSDLVRFTGQLDRGEILRELNGKDVCITPSFSEGFSKVWLDAMLFGILIISYDIGGAVAAVGGNGERGWIVPVGNKRLLADCIYKVISDHGIDWFSLRKACREYAEKHTLEDWVVRIKYICTNKWGDL